MELKFKLTPVKCKYHERAKKCQDKYCLGCGESFNDQ